MFIDFLLLLSKLSCYALFIEFVMCYIIDGSYLDFLTIMRPFFLFLPKWGHYQKNYKFEASRVKLARLCPHHIFKKIFF